MKQPGFTLVELAIVITIIGLLIGGVLKGQELLENARMTSSVAQLKSINSAALVFKDIYKAYPGDISSPANFIQGCTASPCNISGNADGNIGNVYTGGSYYTDENNNFWLHMAKAGLITGIDPNSTWTSAAYWSASLPDFKLGGKITIATYNTAYPYKGILWILVGINAGGTAPGYLIPINTFAKFDLKADDGKPYTGDYFVNGGGCGMGGTETAYDPNNKSPCSYNVKGDF